MRIKKLELFGFKSFADRTDFGFDEGITCIVGPNGCGKSNVVDAVKWILGEQSAKSLRGHEMSDVIFNGSAGRHSLGFAEATLVFDNSARRLPLAAAEVAVTRRLYRSGESEYLLNRQLCRLRDVRELFMDTGVGTSAYSLIEQGKVDVLLQSNPQERREVFEEAAGISKYKAKKKEALRKLERSEQNLLRLGDIVAEVERRLRSVKYQAGKARSWQAHNDRLKELRIMHALNEYSALDRQSAGLAAERGRFEEQHAALDSQAAGLEAQRAELETSLLALEDDLRRLDGELAEQRGEIATADSAISFNRTRLEEWHETQARDRRRIGEMDNRLRELEGQTAEAATEAAAVDGQLSALGARLAESEGAVASAQQAAAALAERLEQEKGRTLDFVQQSSLVNNGLSSLQARAEALGASRARLQKRLAELAEQLARLADSRAVIEREIAALDLAIERDQTSLQAKREEAQGLTAEGEQVAGELAAAKEYRSGLASRKELLEDLERRGEGLEQGVRRVLELSKEGLFPGIRGIVADLVSVDVKYATLIEAALGEAEQHIVIHRRQDVTASLEALQETLEARAGFLPLDSLRVPSAGGHTLPAPPSGGDAKCAETPGADGMHTLPNSSAGAAELGSTCGTPTGLRGVVARAADLVRAADDLRPVVECLLGNTLLVENLGAALELSSGPLSHMRFVTLAGEVVEPDGRLSLGRLTARAGLISRKSELRALDGQLAEVEGRIAHLKERGEGLARRVRELDDRQRELRSAVYDASTTRVDRLAEKRRLEETAQALSNEEPVVKSELDGLERESAELSARRGGLESRLAELEQAAGDQRRQIEALEAELSAAEAGRAQLEEQHTQQRVELAKVEVERRGLEERLSHLESARAETSRQRDEAAEELAACGRRMAEAERTILKEESRIAGLFVAKEALARRCRELDGRREQGRRQAAALQEQVRGLQARLGEVLKSLHEQEMKLSECRMKMESLCGRVRDDFAIDLAQRAAGYVAEAVNWEAVEAEIQELRAKIERLGAVNLEAIKEQEELESRAEFLSAQQRDLEEARRKLDNLIQRINAESVTRFNATFAQVRENFQTLFRKLFGGGKADAVLLDPNDVLESGIEIIARPPGKEPCSISLLSGGEKTLTAVALLLAVFRSKPSPFCILDEVDAALDEANNERFNAVVRDFVADSQFIIITHSKRTMSAADILYGVTMQEPGVSKKIGVRFADIHKLSLEGATPAALADAPQPQTVAGA